MKILDFGLAKLVERAPAGGGATGPGASMAMTGAQDTLPGVVMGTVGYMSPEEGALVLGAGVLLRCLGAAC